MSDVDVNEDESLYMTHTYDALAADYDWMLSDQTLARGGAINQPATARLLGRLPRASMVLDAACGTGVDAAVLARRGFRVWAADGSEAMVERACARFEREGLAVPVSRSRWAELPSITDERFDAVLCIGNSLVHAQGTSPMVEALCGLSGVLRPGGAVVVDSRNWEKLHAERQVVQVADRAVTREGKRCIVLYSWEIPARFDQDHAAHLVFIFEDGEALETHEHVVRCRPFTLGELRRRVQLAGLTEVDTDFDEKADRYSLVVSA